MNIRIVSTKSLRFYKTNTLHILNNLLIRYKISIYEYDKNREIPRISPSETLNL